MSRSELRDSLVLNDKDIVHILLFSDTCIVYIQAEDRAYVVYTVFLPCS